MRCKSRNGIIRWQISKSINVILCSFAQPLTVSEIYKFKIVDLQKVGQGLQFCNYTIRWQMSKYINVIFTFFFIFAKI